MIVTVSSQGRITIPVVLRRKFGIQPNTKILVKEDGVSITLTPITDQYLKRLQGSFTGVGLLEHLLQERKSDNEKESLKY